MRTRFTLLAALLLALPVALPAGEKANRPNIVVVLCDDLGYGDVSCFAHPTIQSPHLDRLAADGVRLTHWAAQHAERVQALAVEMKRLHAEILSEGNKSGERLGS